MNSLFLQQQGAGNGKTYGLIRLLDDTRFHDFENFIFIAKQHSVKYIIFREIEKQATELKNVKIFTDNPLYGKKYIMPISIAGRLGEISVRTVDSLTYSLSVNVLTEKVERDMFTGIAVSISKGIYTKNILNAKTIIFCDETQDMPEIYGRSFLRLLRETGCSLYAVGDLLQSIYFDKNTFRFLLGCDFAGKKIQPPVNICRRFAGPNLINFVNKMVKFGQYGLPEISAADGTGDFKIIKQEPSIVRAVKTIMNIYAAEAKNREPADFLIISPFVKNNALAAALETEIQRYWCERRNKINSYVFLHCSEEYGPIDLSLSEAATRIVSIHTAKGDGRPVVFVINLDEAALLRFSGDYGLIYESLLHVALTRMKNTLYFFNTNTADDIWARISGTKNISYRAFNIGRVHLLDVIKNNLYDTLPLPELDLKNQTVYKDMSFHNLRFQVIMGNIFIKFGFKQEEFKKIQEGGAKLVPAWVDRNAVKFIPIVVIKGLPGTRVLKYMQYVLENLCNYAARAPCALESIFINYAVDKTVSPMILYRAFGFFKHIDPKFHQNCICGQFMTAKNTKSPTRDFFEEVNHIGHICNQFIMEHPEIKWKIYKNIGFTVEFKEIRLPPRIVGKYGDELYIIICKTHLNQLNYKDLLLDILLYEYAFLNYKVKTIVMAINLPEPITVSFTDFINDNIFTIEDLFRKCLMKDFERDMLQKNLVFDGLKSLIGSTKEKDVKNFLIECQNKNKIELGPYSSVGEKKCAEILREIYPDHIFIKCRPAWLEGLELDLYCAELNLAVEFNGIQHYRFTPYFHKTEEDFRAQLRRDSRKAEICRARGIRLIIVKSLLNIRAFIGRENEKKDEFSGF
jgi:hypothetical protein